MKADGMLNQAASLRGTAKKASLSNGVGFFIDGIAPVR
jgi:hypothetical protein